jgi:hypothetical protein
MTRMRTMLAVLAMFCFCVPMLAQCGFVAEPVSENRWYRSSGWELPGAKSGKIIPTEVIINGKPPAWPEGMRVSVIVHRKGYHANFPAAVFEEAGQPKKMKARSLTLQQLLRWEIKGKVYAYSYTLVPDRSLYVFSVDIVDDRGDGVFRLMTDRSLRFSPPALPEWAKKPTT